MKYNKIALIGMMGSGKSTISKLLAKKLSYNALELDEIFEEKQKTTIAEYFKNFGEENFRKIESKILKDSLQKESVVISTGGGAILKKENREILFCDDIFTIYLEADSETIYNRIKNDSTRPLLKVEIPKDEIEKIIKKREQYYNLADLKVNTINKTQEEIVEVILKWIR